MGRAALYYNSSSDSDFNNVPAGTTSVLGGGGTLYSEFGLYLVYWRGGENNVGVF